MIAIYSQYFLILGVALFALGLVGIVVKTRTSSILASLNAMFGGLMVMITTWSLVNANIFGQILAIGILIVGAILWVTILFFKRSNN
jgi:NADH:ubiquinone oxidoreductase subunit K